MSRTPRKKPRRLAPPPNKPVVRVTTPAQMVATLPIQIGYTPEESLVVVCCHEPRGRTGLTMRLDLPAAEHESHVVDYVAETVREQEATRVVLVVYTDETDGEERARERFMNMLLATFEDLIVTEALLVRGGRFWSYQCSDTRCCPLEGTPIDAAAESAVAQVMRLEQLSLGETQMGSRDDLERSLAGPVFLAEEEALQRCDRASEELLSSVFERGLPVTRREAVDAWAAAVESARDPRWQLEPEAAAFLIVSLDDVIIRDTVAAMWVEGDRTLRQLVEQVARHTPMDYDAPVCTLLAWITYCDGAGSITSIALERALRAEPDYSMANLLRHALDNRMSPDFVRGVTERTREAVKERLEDAA